MSWTIHLYSPETNFSVPAAIGSGSGFYSWVEPKELALFVAAHRDKPLLVRNEWSPVLEDSREWSELPTDVQKWLAEYGAGENNAKQD